MKIDPKKLHNDIHREFIKDFHTLVQFPELILEYIFFYKSLWHGNSRTLSKKQQALIQMQIEFCQVYQDVLVQENYKGVNLQQHYKELLISLQEMDAIEC